MNNKQIGSLGELKVATKFMELGYQVFVELGDNSDIVFKNYPLIKGNERSLRRALH